MRRGLAVGVSAIAALVVIAPAAAANGGPITPTEAPGEIGVTGPPGTPSSAMRYSPIPAEGDRTRLFVVETDGGEIRNHRYLDGSWGLPAVTVDAEPGGLSADGGTLVLIEPNYVLSARRTSFLAVDTGRLGRTERFDLRGRFGFDAISPDGEVMYLVEYLRRFDPLDYRVRAFDLSRGELRPGEIVDPAEPDEQMSGMPIARQTSPDGRWAYTLYTGGEEVFVHALDTVGETAVCVDLTQFESTDPFSSKLDLDLDDPTGEVVVLERGDPAATIDPETFEVLPVSAVAGGEAADGGGISGVVIGAGIVALAAVGIGGFAIRRSRRRRAEAELHDVFAAAETDEAEVREPEPVP